MKQDSRINVLCTIAGALAVLLALAEPAVAQDPLLVSVQVWEQAAISTEDTAIQPGGRIAVDGPIALGQSAPLRVYARLDITSLPGQPFDPSNPASFGRSASVRLGSYRQVGEVLIGPQRVTTSIVGEAGFETALRGEVLPRYVRHVGGGIRFDERTSGAYLSIIGARRGGANEILLSAAVPLTLAKGAIVFGGDAVLSFGPDRADVLLLRTALDLNALLGVFKGGK